MSKQIQFDRLDTILALASAEYMRQETEAFLAAETDATLSEESERKITRMIRREKGKNTRRKVWKVLRTVLIAALAAATVALAACMAHPEIREAIWKVVLTWGDESVKIDFVPADTTRKPGSNSAGTNDTTNKPDVPIPDAPKSIEAVRVPGYMPNGWTSEGTLTSTSYLIDYYDNSGTNVVTYWQTIIDTNSRGDADQADAHSVSINGWDGVLLTYEDDPNAYVLYWQDYEYRYNFSGYFESYDQLIRMAESVYVEAGAQVEEAPRFIETIYAPGYMPEGYTTKGFSLASSFMMMYNDSSGEYGFTYKQVSIYSTSRGDAEDAISTEITVNGWDGILLTYENDPGLYLLYWQDYEYRYVITGYFESYDQLIRLAESVYDTSSHPAPPAEPDTPDEPANPPKSIEKVIVPGYMPTGWTTESTMSKKTFMIDYYNLSGENVITYRQRIITSGSEADAEGATATDIKINGFDGVLFTYSDVPSEYVLYWQDTQYRYAIHGQFDSLAQLLRMAESVYDETGAYADEPAKSIETIYAPGYIPTGYTTEGWLLQNNYVMIYYDTSGANVITYNQMIIDSGSYGDSEDGTAIEITINGWDGILLTYSDAPTEYVLYWQDTMYRYNIHGYFDSYDELIRMAESVYD